jgi:hypothetical protein
MPVFEIMSENESGPVATTRVEASSWVEAWQACIRGEAEDETARINVRSLGQSIDVDIQTSQMRYRVRSLGDASPTSLLEDATLRLARLQDEATDAGVDGLPPDTDSSPRPVTRDYDAAPMHQAPVDRTTRKHRRRLDSTQDHPSAPAPPPDPPPVKVEATIRSESPTSRPRGPRGDPRDLPQLFTPMAEFGALNNNVHGRDRSTVLQWAIDTVWQQVPARAVLTLQILGREISITHARGDADRTLRGSRASLDQWPAAMDLRGASRMRFGPEPLAIWFRTLDNMRHALDVTSAMWTPLGARDQRRTDTAKGQSTVLLVIDAARPSGFTEGEFSALCYLNQLIGTRLG